MIDRSPFLAFQVSNQDLTFGHWGLRTSSVRNLNSALSIILDWWTTQQCYPWWSPEPVVVHHVYLLAGGGAGPVQGGGGEEQREQGEGQVHQGGPRAHQPAEGTMLYRMLNLLSQSEKKLKIYVRASTTVLDLLNTDVKWMLYFESRNEPCATSFNRSVYSTWCG